jgi:hypothetical protein
MTIQRLTEYSINTLTSAVQLFIIMTKCRKCNSGINSTYIRQGEKGLWKKVGYYCSVLILIITEKRSYLFDCGDIMSQWSIQRE